MSSNPKISFDVIHYDSHNDNMNLKIDKSINEIIKTIDTKNLKKK